MNEEPTQTTVNPEVWAAAQIEEVAKDLEKKQKRGKKVAAKARGVIFLARPNGEVLGPERQRGEWWAQFFDGDRRRHREKAGTQPAALALYQRRKTEVRQGLHFPESVRRRDTRLKDLVTDYLESIRASQAKTADAIEQRLAVVVGLLGNVEAKTIKAADLERLKAKLTTNPTSNVGWRF